MLRRRALPIFVVSLIALATIVIISLRSYDYADMALYNQSFRVNLILCRSTCLILFETDTSWTSFRSGWRFVETSASTVPAPPIGMAGFSLSDRIVISFGVPSHETIAAFPIWIFAIPWLVIGSISLSRLVKLRWRLRDIQWLDPQLGQRSARFVAFGAVGAIFGSMIGAVGLTFEVENGMTLLKTTAGVILIFAAILMLMAHRRIPLHRVLVWMSLEVAGCITFFAVAAERFSYRLGGGSFDNLTPMNWAMIAGAISFLFGGFILLFVQVRPERWTSGVYCPNCGYCLIGAPRNICSECGRAFTLDELGVSPSDLRPRSART